MALQRHAWATSWELSESYRLTGLISRNGDWLQRFALGVSLPRCGSPEMMLWTAPPPRARECHEGRGAWAPNDSEEPGHADDHDDWSRYREVGFQVHGIDRDGNVVVRRQLKRRYVLTFFAKLAPCLWAQTRACDTT